MMYVGVIIALALIRWEQKELHPKTFLVEVIFLSIFIFLLRLIGTYITDKLDILPPDFLSESLQLWIGGIIFFSAVCYLSFRGWRKKGSRSSSEK
ncbi:hypothetical protein V7112_16045 [Bacillus sp. JJ1566]|uniref:hypothetical protein n=1 Tax=Bacillus sp. JJ1566 TaxID=3122961 RepID=UPI002FFE197D